MIIDTNVLSEVMKSAPEPRVKNWVNGLDAGATFLTATTASEIFGGIALLPDGRRRLMLELAATRLFEELYRDRILPFDLSAARAYAQLNAECRARGYNISRPDAEIAAIALVHGFPVATRDEAPFRAAGIATINPWTAS